MLGPIRIATVIDKRHPLYGQRCHVAPVIPDTQYLSLHPITVINETWHSGFARDEQLKYEYEPSEARPDTLVVSPRDAGILEQVPVLVACPYCTDVHEKGTEQQCVHKPIEVRRMDEAATTALLSLDTAISMLNILQRLYIAANGNEAKLPWSGLYLQQDIKMIETLHAKLVRLKEIGHDDV